MRAAASSAAHAAGVVAAAYNPPEIDEGYKAWLRSRGLGQKRPRPGARPPTTAGNPAVERDREQQLAELERRYPDQFKNGQEGESA